MSLSVNWVNQPLFNLNSLIIALSYANNINYPLVESSSTSPRNARTFATKLAK